MPDAEPLSRPLPPDVDDTSTVEYRLDAKDRIVSVNAQWNAFAESNGAPNLGAEVIIGRPLREFVTGDVTRMFVDTLLQGTRLLGRTRTVHYRCDSTDAKRYMLMAIEPLPDGGILSRHRILRQETFGKPLGFRTGTGEQRRLLKRCSMCNRLSNGTQIIEPEAAKADGWFDADGSATVIYFICKDCQSLVHHKRRPR